jgi:TP901 family phage tail tape measure protein
MALEFGQFEKEAGALLAQMRRSADSLAAIEQEAKAGRVSTSQVESQVTRPAAAEGTATQAEIRSRGLATDQLVARQRALTAAEQESARAESLFAQNMAQSSAGIRTTGALTNEFVEEAKRGAVTIREIGAEVTGTIAKFGGWIVAGGAVYFAFDALTKLKTGAVDATSGVEQMSRVITNLDVHSATEEVKELAKEFNLPIGTVTETAFGIGKAYHDQAQALLATKSALYAVKVGELDAGTATRYLISIINGFHLPASDMAQLFDQLLTAQKRYAIDLPSLMAGVGRAAGSFRAAGGDVHTLIALITTLQHVSGQTGNVIGTAIQRSPHFIAMPQNQSILEQFGINPKGSIEEIYSEAINAAQGKSGQVQRQIAEGLFGPQYGSRVGIFLLQNKKLFEEVFKETSPKHAHGAAEEQLQITLRKTSEQISKIGHQLEQIGLGLAQGHLLDSLGLALNLVNGILELTNSLIGNFDRLPNGAQQLLAYLIQVSLVVKTLRRLNLGESIAGGPVGPVGGGRGAAARFFGYESPQAFAKETREGFLNEQRALEKELSRLSTQQYRAGRRETIAYGTAGAAQRDLQGAVGRYGASSPEVTAAQQRADAAAGDAKNASARSLALANDQEAAAQRLAQVQTSIVATRRKIVGGLDVERTLAEAERLGYPVPAGFTKGAVGSRTLRMAPTQSQLAELETVRALQARGLIPPEAESQAAAAATGVSGAAQKVTAFGTKIGGVRGALGSLGSAFSGLLGKAGTLAIAAFTIGFLSEELTSLAESVGHEFESVTAISNSSQARLQHLQDLKKGSEGGESFKERLFNLTEVTHVGPVPVPTFGLGPEKGIGEERAEVEKAEAKNIENILKLQKRAGKEGKPIPFRYGSEIQKDIEGLKKSHESRKQVEEGLEKYEEELEHSAPSPHQSKELAAARAALDEAKVEHAKGKDLVQALQALKSSQIGERLQANLTLLGGSEGVQYDPAEAKKLGLIYQALSQKIGTSTDPKSVQELDQARQEYFSGVQQAIASELQYQLDLSKTPQDRTQAYAQAISRYRQFSGSSEGELKRQQHSVAKLQKERQKLQAAQEKELETVQGPEIKTQNLPTSKALQKLDQRLGTEKDKLKELADQQSQKQRFIRDIIQKLREEEFQANSALRQAEESAKEALTANPIQQTEEKIRFLGKEVAQAIKVYGRDSQQVFQLITEQRQARQQLVQDQLGLLQARGQLASAGIIQQVPKEKATLYGPGGLIAQLRFEEAHHNAFDPKQFIELEAQVKAAEAQLAYDIQQEANQIADAQFGIREARANRASNPVLAAKVAVEKAKYDVEHAQTPLEKLSAQQNLIQALAAKRDAVAQARLETINYEADIQKISTQQEIEQLENLLHTYKLSLSARRQVREQIHSLKNQLSQEGQAFNLNVGDFSLPTAYDIRRAVLSSGRGAAGATVNQQNSFNIQNYSSDPNVVGRAISNVLGGAAESAARSAGVA